ncbi:MAG: transglycosylase SLT domain-containing protein [Pseudomonadota bacterium]
MMKRRHLCRVKSSKLFSLLLSAALAISPTYAWAETLDKSEQSINKCNQDIQSLENAKARFSHIAECAANDAQLPPQIAVAVIEIESNFNPNARGAAGEVGLMQVMPPTARLLGFSGSLEQLKDPETNISLGVAYLAEAYRLAKGDLCTTVMKYKAGHGETRFSVRSVDYCHKARTILAREGYEVSGTLPKATFGFGARKSAKSGSGSRCIRRSFAPGPNYGRCIASASSSKANRASALRRNLFK